MVGLPVGDCHAALAMTNGGLNNTEQKSPEASAPGLFNNIVTL